MCGPRVDALGRGALVDPGQAPQQGGQAGGERARDLLDDRDGALSIRLGHGGQERRQQRRHLRELGCRSVDRRDPPRGEEPRPQRVAQAIEGTRQLAIGDERERRRERERGIQPGGAIGRVPAADRAGQGAEKLRLVELAGAVAGERHPGCDVRGGEERQRVAARLEERDGEALAAPSRLGAQARARLGPGLEQRRVHPRHEGRGVLGEASRERDRDVHQARVGGTPAGAALSRRGRRRRHRSRARRRDRR